MSDDELDIVRGSDNPFRDAGLSDPDAKLMKADLAAEIIRILRTRDLSGARAAGLPGVTEADLPHPQRRPEPLHHRSPREDPQPPRQRSAGRRQPAAAGTAHRGKQAGREIGRGGSCRPGRPNRRSPEQRHREYAPALVEIRGGLAERFAPPLRCTSGVDSST